MSKKLKELLEKIKKLSKGGVNSVAVEELKALAAEVEKENEKED